jgi:hypothetical protein
MGEGVSLEEYDNKLRPLLVHGAAAEHWLEELGRVWLQIGGAIHMQISYRILVPVPSAIQSTLR